LILHLLFLIRGRTLALGSRLMIMKRKRTMEVLSVMIEYDDEEE
jgi:hypothetical protein